MKCSLMVHLVLIHFFEGIAVAIVVICKEMKKTRAVETSSQESELFQLERKLKLITGWDIRKECLSLGQATIQ